MPSSRIQLISVITALIGTFFFFDLQHTLSLEILKSKQENLSLYSQTHLLQSSALYLLIYITVTSLSLPGATVLTLAGGALFGLLWGTIIVSFASTIGATLAFLAARFLFRETVENKFGDRIKSINAGIASDGAFYLFTLRLVPLFPFFIVNLIMGLTKLDTRTFYWVSQVGMLAGTIVYVNAGTQLAKINSLSQILSPAIVGSLALLGLFPLLAKKIVEHRPLG